MTVLMNNQTRRGEVVLVGETWYWAQPEHWTSPMVPVQRWHGDYVVQQP